MVFEIKADSSAIVYYMLSFLVTSEGLAIISTNPHLHLIKASDNQAQMYVQLAYNISIIVLLSFALRKISAVFGINKATNVNQTLFFDIGIMLALQFYFHDQSSNMKAAIYTLFLVALYLRAISKYLVGSICKMLQIIAQGMLYSIFVVLALKIQLVGYRPVQSTAPLAFDPFNNATSF